VNTETASRGAGFLGVAMDAEKQMRFVIEDNVSMILDY